MTPEMMKKFEQENKQIDLLLNKVAHLIPAPKLPADRSNWNVGHHCINYLDSVLPRDYVLRPSYVWLLVARHQLKLPGAVRVPAPVVKTIISVGQNRRKAMQHMPLKDIDVDLLNFARVANCGELSKIGYDWMSGLGINAHWAGCAFYSPDMKRLEPLPHQFIIFDEREGADLTVAQMFERLDDPNIKICDPWLGESDTAKKMINRWTNVMLHGSNDAKNVAPIPPGGLLVFRPTLDARGEFVDDIDGFLVGRVAKADKCLEIQLMPPQSFQTFLAQRRFGRLLFEGRDGSR